jgi:hypothetical protein
MHELELTRKPELTTPGPDAGTAFVSVARSPGETANRTPMRRGPRRQLQPSRPLAVRAPLLFHVWPAYSYLSPGNVAWKEYPAKFNKLRQRSRRARRCSRDDSGLRSAAPKLCATVAKSCSTNKAQEHCFHARRSKPWLTYEKEHQAIRRNTGGTAHAEDNVGEKFGFTRVEKLASHSRLPPGSDSTNILRAPRRGSWNRSAANT